ncbi:MAG: MFS transporter, partial [Bacteroidota bacterium]|nr:MFS transporter [Bacteroidota bacterium]
QIPVYLLLPMAIMGISFSLIPAVMWPSVSLIVKPAQLGTGYGLMTMIQNIGLAGFNFVIGYANSLSGASAVNKAGYNVGMWIFTSLGFFGLFFAIMLKISNKKNKLGLELPAGIVSNE